MADQDEEKGLKRKATERTGDKEDLGNEFPSGGFYSIYTIKRSAFRVGPRQLQ